MANIKKKKKKKKKKKRLVEVVLKVEDKVDRTGVEHTKLSTIQPAIGVVDHGGMVQADAYHPPCEVVRCSNLRRDK